MSARGVTVHVHADPDRDEPARLHADVVAYVIVNADGILFSRHRDTMDSGLLAAALRQAADGLDHYAEHGTWPRQPGPPS